MRVFAPFALSAGLVLLSPPVLKAAYYSEDFSSPFNAAQQPEWMTNFAYGRDGIMVANSNRADSIFASGTLYPGKLAILGVPHDDTGYTGYWGGRWVLNTNVFSASPVEPFGFEIIREQARLDFNSQNTFAPNNQVMLGIALYADPNALLPKVTNDNTANNFLNAANYVDFMDFDGFGTEYEQKLTFFNGGDRSLTASLRTAVRPDGSVTNVTNGILQAYRSNGNPAVLLNETFSSATFPSGWDGSACSLQTGNNLAGGVYAIELTNRAYVILPPLNNVSHLKFGVKGTNTTASVTVFPEISLDNKATWQRLLATETFNSIGHRSGDSPLTSQNFPIRWEGIWNTNVLIRLSQTNASGFTGFVDNFQAYAAGTLNSNKIGFRMVHDGSSVSFYVNPNPRDENPSLPNEWLFLRSEPVLWSNGIQFMVGHAHRYAFINSHYTGYNRYAQGIFDDLLVRSSTSGSAWRATPGPRGWVLTLSNRVVPVSNAGVNTVRLEGLPGVIDAIRNGALTVRAEGRGRVLVPWSSKGYPTVDEVAWREGEGSVHLVFGEHFHAEKATGPRRVAIEIDGLPDVPVTAAVSVMAEQFASMPKDQRGRYGTCGWERSVRERDSLVVRR